MNDWQDFPDGTMRAFRVVNLIWHPPAEDLSKVLARAQKRLMLGIQSTMPSGSGESDQDGGSNERC